MESAKTETNGDTLDPRNSGHLIATTPEGHVKHQAHTPGTTGTGLDVPAQVIPPYFNGGSLARTDSANNPRAQGGIDLVDQSDEGHEIGRACWARDVSVDDYVVVSGPTGVGAYVVWHCTVTTFKGGDITLRKRYSEFDNLRQNLMDAFPLAGASIPELPRKSLVSRFRPKFLDQRKAGLNHFLTCILLNPQFSRSPIVTEFINSG